MNKKIPAAVGAVIIIIIAITFGVFIWVYEKGRTDVVAVNIPVPMQKNSPPQATSDVASVFNETSKECQYTEKEITVPEALATGEVIFTHDIRQAVGPSIDGYGCLTILGNVAGELVPPDDINKDTFDAIFAHNGLVVRDILADKNRFKVIKIVEVRAQGIKAEYGGAGPIYFLILADDTGTLFQIATVMLQENGAEGKDDIAILRTPSKDYLLTPYNFDKYDPTTGKSDFIFRLEPEENLEPFL